METIKLKILMMLAKIQRQIWYNMPLVHTYYDIERSANKRFWLKMQSSFSGIKGEITQYFPITQESIERLNQATNIAISRMEYFDNTNASKVRDEMTSELQDEVQELWDLFLSKKITALEGNERLKIIAENFNNKGLCVNIGKGFPDE